VTALRALERFVRPAAVVRPEPRCELCGSPIDGDHAHVADLESRAIRCSCRPCGLLFTRTGAARGKYRTVPDRWLTDPTFKMTDVQWASLQIPVRIAFFFFNTEMNRWVAFYPGAAGAAESLLGLDSWAEIAARSALARAADPDVEAILVFGHRHGGFECFLVPIHSCYELVGRVKSHWRGFDGGDEAWREIDGYFDRLRAHSRPMAATDGRSS